MKNAHKCLFSGVEVARIPMLHLQRSSAWFLMRVKQLCVKLCIARRLTERE